MRALEKDRDPGDLAIGKECSGRAGYQQQDESARTEHRLEGRAHRHLFGTLLCGVGMHHSGPSRILEQHEHDDGERDSRKADDQERVAPPHRVGKQATDEHAQQRPDRDTERIEGKRRSALGGFDHVRDQRMRRRCATRLAYPHADPREQQLDEVLRQPAQRGHGRPDRQRAADQPGAVGRCPVREPRDRQAEHGVEQREGETGHQADLRIAQPQFEPDRFGKDIDDLPVDEIEDIDDQQDPQGNPDRSAGLPCCRSRHSKLSRSAGMPVTFGQAL